MKSPKYNWFKEEPGWYILYKELPDLHPGDAVAAVCKEGSHNCPKDKLWCAYIMTDMPPGDKQFETLKKAKAWTEKQVKEKK